MKKLTKKAFEELLNARNTQESAMFTNNKYGTYLRKNHPEEFLYPVKGTYF